MNQASLQLFASAIELTFAKRPSRDDGWTGACVTEKGDDLDRI